MTVQLDPIVLQLTNDRLRRDLSLKKVAKAGGISTTCLHNWERGHTSPTLKNLRRWASGLGYNLSLDPKECGTCGKVRPIVYTDVLGIVWCEECYRDIFLGKGS